MTGPSRTKQFRSIVRRLVAVGAIILLSVIAGSALGAAPAVAATKAYGFQGGSGVGSGWLGNVSTHGLLAYCVDEAGLFPSGATVANGYVGSISATTASADPGHNGTVAVSGADMQKLNFALSKYGQAATTNRKAAALEAYVYSITSSLYHGDDVEQVINIRVTDSADATAVTNGYLAIKADANAHYAAPIQKNSASLAIAMDAVPALTGTITVSVTPSSAPGKLTLTNAVVTATGATTVAVADGDIIPITATRLTGNDLYSVHADATFTAPTTYVKDVYEFLTSSPAYSQRVVTGGRVQDETFTASADAFDPVAPQFEPIVTTSVASKFVDPGEPIDDRLVATVADDADPWLKTAGGAYVPVVAQGLLYCGLSSFPIAGESPPAAAVVAGSEMITLDGPGRYSTDQSLDCGSSGYATWEWSIQASDQTALTQTALPSDYSWSDVFGVSGETAFVRTSISVATAVDTPSDGLRKPVADSVTVSPDGPAWPSDSNRAAVELGLDGTAYWVPGDELPSESTMVPASATAIGSASMIVTSPGTYQGPPITPSASADGFVVWRWSTAKTDYWNDWVENFSAPSQTTQVAAPTMSSVADDDVALTDSASDRVEISGPAMGETADLTWKVYFQATGSLPTCNSASEVFDTSAEPVEVSGFGSYFVPIKPVFTRPGTYFWVASLSFHDGSHIATGVCGVADEISHVEELGLSTKAIALAPSGVGVSDTATIVGPVPAGATLSFSAYKQRGSASVCDSTTLLYSSRPAPLDSVGQFQSPIVNLPPGRYVWVARAFDRAGRELKSDPCGIQAETTRIVTVLAYTGEVSRLSAPYAGTLAVLMGAAAIATRRRYLTNSRRTNRRDRLIHSQTR